MIDAIRAAYRRGRSKDNSPTRAAAVIALRAVVIAPLAFVIYSAAYLGDKGDDWLCRLAAKLPGADW